LIRITEEDENSGYIEEIKERTNEIKRPPVANAQQLLIIFAVKNPQPSFLLLDKLLIAAELNNLKPVICFNKADLAEEGQKEYIQNTFKNTGYKIIFTSKYNEDSLQELKSILKDKLNVFSGPSGVGKSSIMNAVQPDFYLQTGEISEKLKRGKHTTRHVEIFKLSFGGYAVDTPGFSQMDLADCEPSELQECYPEYEKYRHKCYFNSCAHVTEPDCMVREAVKNGELPEGRYRRYIKFIKEINEYRRNAW